ncbi:MAG: cobalamin biosynthesis Mg chelatase CobN, partial [Candidatus Azotimanducaceae bacterium]
MSVIPITCDNCGAKYKLPPTFKGTQAKCQKCGSVIDVAKQRESAGSDSSPAAAAKPAASRPAAAAKPAVDRSKSRTAGRKTAAAAASPKADKPARGGSSRSRRGAKDDDGEDTSRRGREKKKDNTPMIIGGVGLLALVVVVVVMMMGGDDPKLSNEAATVDQQVNAADANATKPEVGNLAVSDEGTKPEA